ncbi:restriction endonuclease subunit S [Treponema pectinovorum]|uniref:restriction endonuclease subunit S n=1 Tax=Treponema pectinovorum TaxID=164 RepID=UPI003D8C3615
MNTKALRQKILDLAIHGKLVPQNPKDESATVLLEKIRTEKAEKIKQGELKANKKDSFIFVGSDKRHYEQFADGTVKDIEDEIPFDVPEGWAWTKIHCVSSEILYGVSESAKEKGKYKLLRITDIQDDKVNWDSVPFTDFPEDKITNYILKNGDIVFARTGATVGKSYLIENLTVESIYASYLIRIRTSLMLNPKYMKYYFGSLTYWNQITDKSSGIGQPNVNGTSLANLYIPIPPYNEQERILPVIEKAFRLINSLENNKSALQTAIKQAKSKILDLAIHGKLVPQDPNDEPAVELLKRIATSDNRPYKKFEDEVPFDLPDTWEWCNLDDIYNHTTGKALKKSNSTGTLHKYITTSNLYWNSFDFTEVRSMYFTDEELEKCTIKKGDLILCNGGDVGRTAIWNYDYDICYQNHVSRLRPKSVDINNYFYLYLLMLYKESGLLAGKGIGITSLSASDLLTTTLPLPPLAEQQRIVTKIEELFAQLDSISEQLA